MYKQHIIRTLIFGFVGLVVALLAGLLSPKEYEGRVEMLIGDAGRVGGANTLTEEVSSIVDRGRQRNAATERQILSSQGVFFRAVQAVAERTGDNGLLVRWPELYRRYDVETARTNTQTEEAGVAIIKVRAGSPELASEIANQIGFVFNEVRQQESRAALEDGIRALEGRVQVAERELRAAENRLQAFKTKEGIADMSLDIQGTAASKNNLDAAMDQVTAELAAARATVTEYRRQLQNLPNRVLDTEQEASNPMIAQLEGQINQLLQERAVLSGTYLDDSPQIVRIDSAIRQMRTELAKAKREPLTSFQKMTRLDTLRQTIQANLKAGEAQVASLTARANSLANEMSRKEATVTQLPERERQVMQLQRDVAIQDENYRRDRTQLEVLRSRAATGVRSAATILNTAQPDPEPIAPDVTKFAFIGLFAGLSLGLLVSFLIDSLKSNIRSAAQLSYLTGLPVVASVPALKAPAPRALKALARRTAEPAEGYRYMAFALGSTVHSEALAYGFTGTRAVASSSVGALQFAISAAKTGQRVLVIDAELSRPQLTRAFDLESAPGLREALAGGAASLDELAQSTPYDNLRLLASGKGETQSLADYASVEVERVIEAARALADVVVVTLPPCDLHVDAVALSRLMNVTVLTVSGQRTNANQIADVVDMLKNAGVTNLRLVLADATSVGNFAMGESSDLARVE